MVTGLSIERYRASLSVSVTSPMALALSLSCCSSHDARSFLTACPSLLAGEPIPTIPRLSIHQVRYVTGPKASRFSCLSRAALLPAIVKPVI